MFQYGPVASLAQTCESSCFVVAFRLWNPLPLQPNPILSLCWNPMGSEQLLEFSWSKGTLDLLRSANTDGPPLNRLGSTWMFPYSKESSSLLSLSAGCGMAIVPVLHRIGLSAREWGHDSSLCWSHWDPPFPSPVLPLSTTTNPPVLAYQLWQ